MITLTIEDRNGSRRLLKYPKNQPEPDGGLKASEHHILATCGGMALCATCHVQVLEGPEQYFHPSDTELDLLDTLPDAGHDSRLACQLRINEDMDGMVFRIKGESNKKKPKASSALSFLLCL